MTTVMGTKDRILERARQLFFSIGYDKTSVQRIIDDVGIAKGTFYHHFKTKEQLLDELTDRLVQSEVVKTNEAILLSDMTALEKFNNMVSKHGDWKSNHFDLLYTVLKAYYSDNNHYFRAMMRQKNSRNFAPIFENIIRQGIKEGVFKTEFPKEMSEMIVRLSNAESEEIMFVMLNYKDFDDPVKEIIKRYHMLMHAMEKILGAHEGAIKIEIEEIMTAFVAFLKTKEV